MQKWNKIQQKVPQKLAKKKKYCYTKKVIYFLITKYMINSFFTIWSKPMRPNRFYRETVDQSESPNSKGMKPIEPMKDPGYHIGKIDTQTLNAMSDFWLKIENGKNEKGEGSVLLNMDGKFKVSLSQNGWQAQEIQAAFIGNGTKEIYQYINKASVYNSPNRPLEIVVINTDGTQDRITFEKKKSSEVPWITEVDKLLQKWVIRPIDLDDSHILKNIITNWPKVSNESVSMIKGLIIQYAQRMVPNYKDKPRNLAEAADFSNIPWYDLANTPPEKLSVTSLPRGANWKPELKVFNKGGRELITFTAD